MRVVPPYPSCRGPDMVWALAVPAALVAVALALPGASPLLRFRQVPRPDTTSVFSSSVPSRRFPYDHSATIDKKGERAQ